MKKIYRVILFFLVLAGDLIAVQLNFKIAEYIFKPLIIIWLLAWFILQTRYASGNLKKWIIAALLFSWAGDVFLMLQDGGDSIFFLAGLSAFLIAHIFYMIFFHFVRVSEYIRGRWYLLLSVVIYYLLLISFLSPYLGSLGLPVRIYGIVISFMLMLAMHMLFIRNKIAGRWMMAGATLFVISDSLLAINKFYQPFEFAGILIMFTYGMAQLFIIEGAIRYINSVHKR